MICIGPAVAADTAVLTTTVVIIVDYTTLAVVCAV